MSNPRLYKFIKTIWLLLHGAIMPGAVAFLVLHGYLSAQSAHLGFYPVRIVGSALIVLWIIGISLLAMYRFPLTVGAAGRMVVIALLQFILIFIFGGDALFALYSNFLGSFVAIAVLLVVMLVVAFFMKKIPRRSVVFVLMAVVIAPLVVWKIGQPFVDNLKLMALVPAGFSAFIAISNTVSIIAGLYKLSVFGGGVENKKGYDEEWERWAPATVIVLILSAVVAFALGGIMQAAAA